MPAPAPSSRWRPGALAEAIVIIVRLANSSGNRSLLLPLAVQGQAAAAAPAPPAWAVHHETVGQVVAAALRDRRHRRHRRRPPRRFSRRLWPTAPNGSESSPVVRCTMTQGAVGGDGVGGDHLDHPGRVPCRHDHDGRRREPADHLGPPRSTTSRSSPARSSIPEHGASTRRRTGRRARARRAFSAVRRAAPTCGRDAPTRADG